VAAGMRCHHSPASQRAARTSRCGWPACCLLLLVTTMLLQLALHTAGTCHTLLCGVVQRATPCCVWTSF
jgi:hypothetical protein